MRQADKTAKAEEREQTVNGPVFICVPGTSDRQTRDSALFPYLSQSVFSYLLHLCNLRNLRTPGYLISMTYLPK